MLRILLSVFQTQWPAIETKEAHMDCSVKVMRRPAALLATIFSIVCAAAFVFPTLAFAEEGGGKGHRK